MTARTPTCLLALSLLLGAHQPATARVLDATVTRSAQGTLDLRWTARGPVDVYQAATPDAAVKSATVISADDRDGAHSVTAPAHERPYFLLRDRHDGAVTRVAERLVPLDQGSNFRDIGGYPGAGGKSVRWGMLFRSGATPMLSNDDLAEVRSLGLRQMIDLRSNEERVRAPSRITAVPYTAIGYSFADITGAMPRPDASGQFNMEGVYRNLPTMLAPHMRLLFASMLRGEAPLVYNCSAGQDRTGFASALILTALGVDRKTIYADYLLSTAYRKTEFEMPRVEAPQQGGDAITQTFSKMGGIARTAQPLHLADGTPFLSFAFAEIERKWGSVDAYLKAEAGIGPVQIAALRARYLE